MKRSQILLTYSLLSLSIVTSVALVDVGAIKLIAGSGVAQVDRLLLRNWFGVIGGRSSAPSPM